MEVELIEVETMQCCFKSSSPLSLDVEVAKTER